MSAYDLVSDQFGPALDWSTMTDDDLTFLSACSDFEEGFSYLKINGEEKIFNSFEVVQEGEKTILKSQDDKVRLSFRGASAKIYRDEEVNVYINDIDFGSSGYFMDCQQSVTGCGVTDFHVTHFEEGAEGWLRVSFSGTLWMQTLINPVAGNYNLEGVIMTKR